MRVLLTLGVVVLLGMQVRLWFSDIGVLARNELSERLAEQTRRTTELEERNRRLAEAGRRKISVYTWQTSLPTGYLVARTWAKPVGQISPRRGFECRAIAGG